MGLGLNKLALRRWLRLESKDPLWENFIQRPPSDPRNDLNSAIIEAPEGSVFPVKTEVSDAAEMARNLKELACWLGAASLGIVSLSYPASDANPGEENEQSEGEETTSRHYPSAFVCTIAAEHDPRTAKGLGGQLAVRNGAVVNHHLRAYIKEMGYRATFGGVDPAAVAKAAGLGQPDSSGRFITGKRGAGFHLADAILTDLPLTPDATL